MHKHSDDVESQVSQERALAGLAFAMSDVSRMKMLCALMDGRAWTATELAVAADIAPSTASAHLCKLVDSRLIVGLSQGRHRYFRLTGRDVAGLLEQMMGLTWQATAHCSTPVSLRKARTCYDHLAGEVAVAIFDFLLREAWVADDGEALTPKGVAGFTRMGVTLSESVRRKPCSACLDWSERRFHLGGMAGAALLLHVEQKGWIARTPGYREVRITSVGQLAFRRYFEVDC
ncbi:ArsR/SmtB family transcription factor [[Enterobacter] lignolyticus]|uniref:Regulatory protein ArsR n=1 Tax=Enterobacter lignolyticus (strain SCF1) TaxID=701347 RepID=E3GCS5_ENTLS|nr:winged helix-turn-helix domain-containing protein [[Enterobacter] lignolyticus]ADO47855.1 regulatory protein ArsR [[Enterobacter] lignolyticus SCF1]